MKILVISDTHGLHQRLQFLNEANEIKEEYKDVEAIIHCGDCTSSKRDNDIQLHVFLEWFNDLPFKYKILIAGNHDMHLEKMTKKDKTSMFKQFFPEVIYLEDSEVIINGIKIYGTPWTPTFMNWAFMTSENKLTEIFSKIPNDTQILVTHGPAYSVLDLTYSNQLVGSQALKERIEMIDELKFHCFGHIHEERGTAELKGYTAINAALFDYYSKDFKPILIEI